MNLIENGVKSVIRIDKVIEEKEMYFKVLFVDLYGSNREKRFSDIRDIENKTWRE